MAFLQVLNKLFDNDEIEMWKINEAFLKQQTAAKKTIIFSQDPSIAKAADGRWDSSSFGRELDYLENTAKYRISDTVNEIGYYYAIPTK